MPEPQAPAISAGDFAALITDLRAEITAATRPRAAAILAYRARPAAFAGRPWTARPVLLSDAARLAGCSPDVLRHRAARAARGAVPPGRHPFPAPLTPGRRNYVLYAAGDIAVWLAGRPPARTRAGTAPAPARAAKGTRGREEAAGFLARLVAADPGMNLAAARQACAAQGIPLSRFTAARVLDDARAAALPAILAGLPSPRADGKVTPGDVARAFGTTRGRVRRAVADLGTIRGVKENGRWWIDPSRLRFRSEMSRRPWGRLRPPMPVDKDDLRAFPAPGDEKETARRG